MGNESSTPKDRGESEMPHPYTITSTPAGGPSRPRSPATSPGPSTPVKDPRNNMIVVSTGKGHGKKSDPVLESLERIPPFLPIIGTSIGGAINRDMPMIDDKLLVCVCNRFKEHLSASSKGVVKRQDEIGNRVRLVEKNASGRANHIGKTAQLLQKAEARLVDVDVLQNEVLKLSDRIHYVILPKLQALNGMLPADHQLEPVAAIFADVAPSAEAGAAEAAKAPAVAAEATEQPQS